MATEIKNRITAEDNTGRAFRSFRQNVKTAERQIGDLRKFVAGVAGAVAAAFGGAKIVGTLREFETLKASLKTVTGSAEAAGDAFKLIEDFAATTPFQLQEVVSAFVRLKALGLDPSREALEAYGNVAAAMGTSLTQFIEAVADATTGEFERLKEFGIRSQTEGDRVAFTFRGITTVVQKEAGAIEGYLRSLGQVDFAGAMAERAATLDGALSNLSDSFSSLARAFGDAGLTQLVTDFARALSTLTGEMVKSIKEGEGLLRTFQGLGSGIGLVARGNDQRELGRLIARETALSKEIRELESGIEQQTSRGGIVVPGLFKRLENLKRDLESNLAQQRGLQVVLPPEQTGAAPAPTGDSGTGRPARENQTLGGGDEDKAAKRRATELANLVRRRQEEADAVGRTEREVTILKATQLGANQVQLNAINLAFDRIEADERLQEELAAEEDALEKTRRAREAANREAEAMDQELEQQAEQFRQLIDPLRTYQLELERLDEVYKAGKLTQEEFASATTEVQKQLAEAAERLNETDNAFTEFAVQGARNIQDAFADFLFDPLKDGFDGMLKNFSNVIRRMAAEVAAAELGKQLFGDFGKTGKIGGAAGGLFGALANVFHEGGIVGLPAPSRMAPALAFAGAARYHDGGVVGLRPGERGIIAKDGEEVLTRRDPRHRYNGGGMQLSVTANVQGAIDERSSDQIAVAVANAATRARLRNT